MAGILDESLGEICIAVSGKEVTAMAERLVDVMDNSDAVIHIPIPLHSGIWETFLTMLPTRHKPSRQPLMASWCPTRNVGTYGENAH